MLDNTFSSEPERRIAPPSGAACGLMAAKGALSGKSCYDRVELLGRLAGHTTERLTPLTDYEREEILCLNQHAAGSS